MLESLDMTQTLDEQTYDETLKELQLALVRAQRKIVERRIPAVIVFEGMDAAGKGGAIRRLTSKLDPRGFEVHPIGPPDDHECRFHYMRRFWVRLPAYGRIGVFDRSWYGRCLVERVENLAPKGAQKRAYDEINEFERELVVDDHVLVKFWLHITKEEQLKRFEARGDDPYKRWKLTKDDWHNREKWDNYVQAADEMLEKTSTPGAPWTVVAANDKLHTRVTVLRSVVEAIGDALGKKGFGHAGEGCDGTPGFGARSVLEVRR